LQQHQQYDLQQLMFLYVFGARYFVPFLYNFKSC
jgi:hypothetical protein